MVAVISLSSHLDSEFHAIKFVDTSMTDRKGAFPYLFVQIVVRGKLARLDIEGKPLRAKKINQDIIGKSIRLVIL